MLTARLSLVFLIVFTSNAVAQNALEKIVIIDYIQIKAESRPYKILNESLNSKISENKEIVEKGIEISRNLEQQQTLLDQQEKNKVLEKISKIRQVVDKNEREIKQKYIIVSKRIDTDFEKAVNQYLQTQNYKLALKKQFVSFYNKDSEITDKIIDLINEEVAARTIDDLKLHNIDSQ